MNPKARSILNFIQSFIAREHYPPTYEEIRVGCGLSTKSLVDYHLNALESAGHIARRDCQPRGIRLVEATCQH